MSTQHEDAFVWTWEPFAAALAVVAMAAVLAIHTARGVALWIAGLGFHWPPSTALLTSIGGIITGDVHAGLTTQGPASVLLTWAVAAALTGAVIALISAFGVQRHKQRRFNGMATTTQAQQLLGLRRLRANRKVIRPDLYLTPRPPA